MARNIKASPPWQRSRAGLYWHPRDSAGQGELGCRSPLSAPAGPSREATGEGTPVLPRAPAEQGRPLGLRGSGSAPPARPFPASRPLIPLAPSRLGSKSARRPRPASGEQTKLCGARPCGRAGLAVPVNVQSGPYRGGPTPARPRRAAPDRAGPREHAWPRQDVFSLEVMLK